MKRYRRRKTGAKKNPRRSAAQKRAQRKATLASKRARRNPIRRKKRSTAKRAAPRRSASAVRRRRRNPPGMRPVTGTWPQRAAASPKKGATKKKAGAKKGGSAASLTRADAVAEAKAMGLKASGTTAQIHGRIAAKHARLRGGSTRKKKKGSAKKGTAKRRTRSLNARGQGHTTWARSNRKKKVSKTLRRGKNKGSKRAVSSPNARVAKAYLKTQRLKGAIRKGSIKGGAATMAKAMGLTRVNPASSVLKDFATTAKALAIPTIITVGGMYGMALAGMRASAGITKIVGDKIPAIVAKNIVPVTTVGLSLAAAMLLRRGLKRKLPLINMDGAQLAPWVAVGGMGAALLMVMTTTEWGKKLTAKMGLSFSLDPASTAEAAAASPAGASSLPAKGLGAYMTVSQYLGAYGVEIDPMGPSWYGRGDISPMGDFVDAGPQNQFGAYMASDFPVHAPGPGDNTNVMAQLGAYDEGVFASGYGAAYPEGGYGALELEETPGGTMLSMGEAGIFGGKGII